MGFRYVDGALNAAISNSAPQKLYGNNEPALFYFKYFSFFSEIAYHQCQGPVVFLRCRDPNTFSACPGV